MAGMEKAQKKAMETAKALLSEHFGAAVIVVPLEDDAVTIEQVGHRSHGLGLLHDAYMQVFEGGGEVIEDDDDDDDSGTTVPG